MSDHDVSLTGLPPGLYLLEVMDDERIRWVEISDDAATRSMDLAQASTQTLMPALAQLRSLRESAQEQRR